MGDRYIVERELEHVGYKCVVTFCVGGYRCGYVGVPKNHPLYGKKYLDHLEIKKEDLKGREISGIQSLMGAYLDEDERIRIEAYFQCHGGITFADGGKTSNHPIDSDLWWFGFDCGHYGDAHDLKLAYEKFPDYRDVTKIAMETKIYSEGIIRTEDYAAAECKKLAEQLKEFEESEE